MGDRPRPHRGGKLHRPRGDYRRRRDDRRRSSRPTSSRSCTASRSSAFTSSSGDDFVRVPPRQELVVQDDLGGHVPKIEDGPWPAFPSDLTSVALTVATQAAGTILMFEKMFENRLFFTDKLVSMGARIILCDPHRAVVTGPSKLRGQRMESPDIRAGMAMLLASLCAGRIVDDRRRVPDRQGLRTDRRAPPRARCADRTRRRLTPTDRVRSLPMAATGQGRASARSTSAGRGETNVATGVAGARSPAGDAGGLCVRSTSRSRSSRARRRWRSPRPRGRSAKRSHEPLRADGARGHGSAVVPADEALAHVALEASGRPLLVSNVDLSQARIAGLAGDLAARFLEELAQTGGLDAARAARRGKGHAARPRSDLQGARRRARTGMPTAKEERRMKEVVRTEAAPAPFQGAPYSQAIKANGFVFVAGQVAEAGRSRRSPAARRSGADRTGARKSPCDPRGGRKRLGPSSSRRPSSSSTSTTSRA